MKVPGTADLYAVQGADEQLGVCVSRWGHLLDRLRYLIVGEDPNSCKNVVPCGSIGCP